MSVVQRCPNCGTTQATPGDCEACHEAHVRYFCTNHEPGIWLAGRACPQCEARSALPARPTASTSALPSRGRPAALGADARAPGDKRERPRPVDEATPEVRPSRRALRDKLLRDAVLVHPAPPPAEAAPEREPASRGHADRWLLRLALRLVLIAVVLAVALGVAVYLAARSLH
jgi:hypothetical protein